MLKLRSGVLLSETEYGTVLLDEVSGQYWNLNPPGATILAALRAGDDIETAVSMLTTEYAVGSDKARTDTLELVGQLRQAGLVEEQSAP